MVNLLSTLFGPNVPSISASELNEKLRNGRRPLILDVRQPEEYREGHIAGSKLVPLGELGKRIKELPGDREIICVCATGSRSRSATKLLVGAGYNAYDMKGGMFMWQRSNFSVKKGGAA